MSAQGLVTFTKLNEGWNAEPNAPEATATVCDDTVVLEFSANAFAFPGFDEGDRLRLVFVGASRYRLGPTNDEGWWMGQCRFGRAAPAWGDFYEVEGDMRAVRQADDWRLLETPAGSQRHFLFYLRDDTFECEARDWHLEQVSTWKAASELFEWDGSWRDLYVFSTTIEDWDRVMRALAASAFQSEFTRGGVVSSMPRSFAEHFNAGAERPLLMLSVIIDGVRFNAHLFCEDEIEFDIDPREVSDAKHFDALVAFMNFVANAVAKPVVLTPENGPQHSLLVARPGIAGVAGPFARNGAQ